MIVARPNNEAPATSSQLSVLTGPTDVSMSQDGDPKVHRVLEQGEMFSRNTSDDQITKAEDQNIEDAPKGHPTLTVVTWDGPEDPANPQNWGPLRKWFAMTAVGWMCFVSSLASTLIAPAAETIAQDPDFMITNPTVTPLLVSIFILGFTFGPLVASPISELYGRNWVLQGSMGIFFVFNIACAVSRSTAQMIVFRFLAGAGGAAPITVGGGVLTDLVPPHERGAAMSIFAFTTLFGPVAGPIAGGFIVENLHWRWCLWLLVIVSGVTFVVSPFILSETYHPTILQRKAARIRKETGNENVTTAHELANGKKTPKQVIILNLTRPFVLLFTSPACFIIGLYMAISYGYLYLMYTTFELVFVRRYHESRSISGLNYLAPGLGNFFGCFICAVCMDRVYIRLTKRNGGISRPEFRIPMMLVASFFMPVGLIIYGWTAENHAFWFWPDFGIFIFSSATILTFLAMNTYIVDAFKYAASALAACTVMRSLAGALFPLVGASMFDSKLGLGWGNTVLALVALTVGLTYPIFLWYYGPKLRAKGKTDR